MNMNSVLILARKHLGKGAMPASARLALADAVALVNDGKLDDARRRALKSLAYSVGLGHQDYRRAASADLAPAGWDKVEGGAE